MIELKSSWLLYSRTWVSMAHSVVDGDIELVYFAVEVMLGVSRLYAAWAPGVDPVGS